VGILAALGVNQYSNVVEQGRTAEAKARIGTMAQLAYQYWLEHSDMTNIQYADVGVDGICHSTDFYRYEVQSYGLSNYVNLLAVRCTSGGKTPNINREYMLFLSYHLDTGVNRWACHYSDDFSASCFGMWNGN